MLARQRHDKILKLLETRGRVHTAELVDLMDVSSETIRKDLELLDSQGKLTRVHGGAVPLSREDQKNGLAGYVPLKTRSGQNLEQKAAIARRAVQMVEEGQSVALDYGSTSQIMAMALRDSFSQLTVITNSIQNALLLADNPGITVILLGGILNRDELTLVDAFSTVLDNFHIDIMFMSVTGIDPDVGLTDQRLSEMRIQNKMHRLAGRTVVLADSSKFGRTSLLKICSVQDVDAIITDSGLDAGMRVRFGALGANLIIAQTDSPADTKASLRA